MKTVKAKRGFPTSFAKKHERLGILLEAHIRPRGRGTLAAKLLVFDSPRSMHEFWEEQLGHGLHGALGAVNNLSSVVESYRGNTKNPKVWRIVDPRYACIIALCKEHLTFEIIVHEATHAGFAFAARSRPGLWDKSGNEEEDVCYPTGRVAAAIDDLLFRRGLYGARKV